LAANLNGTLSGGEQFFDMLACKPTDDRTTGHDAAALEFPNVL